MIICSMSPLPELTVHKRVTQIRLIYKKPAPDQFSRLKTEISGLGWSTFSEVKHEDSDQFTPPS